MSMTCSITTGHEGPTPLDALLDRAAHTPDALAIVADGQSWSCGRLAASSARLADAFRAHGVRPGDRIAVHMFNLPEAALAYLACWLTGATAVPLNTRYKESELAALIRRVKPALYLGHADLYEGVRGIDMAVLPMATRFIVGLEGSEDGAQSWTALVAPESGVVGRDQPVDRHAPAVLLATSGTTGPSKLVIWTPNTLAAFAVNATDRGFEAEQVFVLVTPMMHASGMVLFASCLLTGALMVLVPQFEADAVLDAMSEHRCTIFAGLPFMYTALARRQQERPRDLGFLSLCLAAGDVCSGETEEAFQAATGRPILSLWASTEEAGATKQATKPGPLTRLSAKAEMRLIDEAGKLVVDGEAGEMLIRSPTTTPGYWLEPGRIDPLPDGWFHSGDLLRQEPDGQLRYMGRLKDLIVRGGSNVSPVEIEEALRRQHGVTEAAVVGLPDPELGQRVGAALILAEGIELTNVLDGVRRDLADYKVPERIAVVEVIPHNALSKIDRDAVVKMVGERAAT